MKVEEQEHIKQKGYAEAMRYIANAKELLIKAGQDGRYYKDRKYVRSACGTAYSGVLEALDAWFKLKGIELPKGRRKSINFYEQNIGMLDKKMLKTLDSVYSILHICGYYDGNLDSDVIKIGFSRAKELINLIKPSAGGAL
ncbi:MAG: DUF5618 family protein [Candidatus Fibromonas sp.]|jgi:hypothetical protein|nr:DUF5618 family protein [Candidatus Fibromonas sp.]